MCAEGGLLVAGADEEGYDGGFEIAGNALASITWSIRLIRTILDEGDSSSWLFDFGCRCLVFFPWRIICAGFANFY